MLPAMKFIIVSRGEATLLLLIVIQKRIRHAPFEIMEQMFFFDAWPSDLEVCLYEAPRIQLNPDIRKRKFSLVSPFFFFIEFMSTLIELVFNGPMRHLIESW